MRRSPQLDKALLLLSDPARPGWVVVDAWAVRGRRVAFRTQSGQFPNTPETCEIDRLAKVLSRSANDVVRELRACSKSPAEPSLQTRLQLAIKERERIKALRQFLAR